MSSENDFIPPYFLVKANNIEYKTYTQSGVDISIQILDRFKVDYTIEHVKE